MNATEVFTLERALQLDAADPLREARSLFHIPRMDDGTEQAYFTGNSLGLQLKSTEAFVMEGLSYWKRFSEEGHFKTLRSCPGYGDFKRRIGENTFRIGVPYAYPATRDLTYGI